MVRRQEFFEQFEHSVAQRDKKRAKRNTEIVKARHSLGGVEVGLSDQSHNGTYN